MSGNIMTTKELPDFYLGIFNMSLLAVFICFVRCYQHTSYSLITSTVLYEIARQNATTIFSIISSIQTALKLFIFLFIFRYLRLVVHIVGWWLYTPASLASSPVFSSSDVTVIVPTVDPAGVSFRECISSVISNDPTLIIIITAGPCPTDDETNFDKLEREWRDHPKIHLMECGVMNKREQLCTALAEVSVVKSVDRIQK